MHAAQFDCAYARYDRDNQPLDPNNSDLNQGKEGEDVQAVADMHERTKPVLREHCIKIDPLTAREQEVLCLVAEGMTNKEIAVQLVISEHTVENHMSQIYQKLDVCNRVQAARWQWTMQTVCDKDSDNPPCSRRAFV